MSGSLWGFWWLSARSVPFFPTEQECPCLWYLPSVSATDSKDFYSPTRRPSKIFSLLSLLPLHPHFDNYHPRQPTSPYLSPSPSTLPLSPSPVPTTPLLSIAGKHCVIFSFPGMTTLLTPTRKDGHRRAWPGPGDPLAAPLNTGHLELCS